jgi:hypothetical protein
LPGTTCEQQCAIDVQKADVHESRERRVDSREPEGPESVRSCWGVDIQAYASGQA